MHRILLGVAVSLGLCTAAQAENGWKWTVAPYLLAPSIDGSTSIGRLEDADLSVNPTDIINVLDLAFMGYVDGLHDSGWGFTLDYSFMDLSDNGTFAGGAGAANAEIFQGIMTASVYRRVIADADRTVDLYGGVRWWNMDINVDATLGPVSRSVEVTPSWVDPLLGVRYKQRLGQGDWSFVGQADVGGFGVNSKFAWTLKAGVLWQATDLFAMDLSYMAIGVDYEEGTPGTVGHFAYDTITHGPYLGFVFTF